MTLPGLCTHNVTIVLAISGAKTVPVKKEKTLGRGVARFFRFNMTMTGAIQNSNMKIRELVIPEAEACVLDCKSVFKYNFVAADAVCFRSLY